ncbi:hypothetical protein BaRGS_00025858 [Batillaria attramentaria]|uniref:Uncharacterized protein n=1 Tax=Batillaria attramentaria TaxID=370345 RepID=A0ABD0K772_9CAEN
MYRRLPFSSGTPKSIFDKHGHVGHLMKMKAARGTRLLGTRAEMCHLHQTMEEPKYQCQMKQGVADTEKLKIRNRVISQTNALATIAHGLL